MRNQRVYERGEYYEHDSNALPFGSRELAVISFANGQATLVETAPGVTVDVVVANSEADLVVPARVPQMTL